MGYCTIQLHLGHCARIAKHDAIFMSTAMSSLRPSIFEGMIYELSCPPVHADAIVTFVEEMCEMKLHC